jgi:hypothetical protein
MNFYLQYDLILGYNIVGKFQSKAEMTEVTLKSLLHAFIFRYYLYYSTSIFPFDLLSL